MDCTLCGLHTMIRRAIVRPGIKSDSFTCKASIVPLCQCRPAMYAFLEIFLKLDVNSVSYSCGSRISRWGRRPLGAPTSDTGVFWQKHMQKQKIWGPLGRGTRAGGAPWIRHCVVLWNQQRISK